MATIAATERRYRPTVATIDLDAIRANVRALAPPRAELMAVVKANGYGHGATEVARAALEAGATWLGVALVEEGLRLRDAGVEASILVLSEAPPGAERDALAAGLTPTVYTPAGIAGVAAARDRGSARVHLKVDTGMHRVGAAPEDAAGLARAAAAAGLEVEGVWTHLARAEERSDPTTERQLALFADVCAELERLGIRPRYRHAANSGGTIAWPAAHLDLVRVGIAMYGVSPGPELDGEVDLGPAMPPRSRVSFVKRVGADEGVSYGHRFRTAGETTIATVPVGYADGYLRALSGRGRVLLRGRRYSVAGTVTMDQLMVVCGRDPGEAGD